MTKFKTQQMSGPMDPQTLLSQTAETNPHSVLVISGFGLGRPVGIGMARVSKEELAYFIAVAQGHLTRFLLSAQVSRVDGPGDIPR